MSMTLYEISKRVSGDVKRSAIIEMFSLASSILRVMPFENLQADSFTYMQEGRLPGVGFRSVNGAFAESYGVINQAVEVLRYAGGDLDVDLSVLKARGEGVRTTEEAMKVKAIALFIGDTIINGDSLTNPNSFDGLRRRVTGAQLFPANLGAPTANSPLSLESLQAAIDQVDDPNGIILSKAMRRKLSKAARANLGGEITVEKDEFGFRVEMFDGLPLMIVDYNSLGQRIIEFNEAGPAGGGVSTSVYVVNYGPSHVTGLQNGEIDVRDLGELEAKPAKRTRVDWTCGLAVMHGRAVARVWGITNADVTA